MIYFTYIFYQKLNRFINKNWVVNKKALHNKDYMDNTSAIDIFTKISKKYQYQLRKKFTKDLCGRLSDHLDEHEIDQVMKELKLRTYTAPKKTAVQMDPTKHAEETNRSNLLKYLIRELKENMSKCTPMLERNRIAQQVINQMNKGSSFEDAKKRIYELNNIYISYKVGEDNDRSNLENMNVEREYDEYCGKVIYGWDDHGEILYEPTFGCLISPPSFKYGGERWREILDNRWEQKSSYDDDETIHEFKG